MCNSRQILPGMQQLIRHIADDERRHMAWGTFTCRRHVAADDSDWSVVEDQMGRLMKAAMALTSEIYGRFPDRRIPFGVDQQQMHQYVVEKLGRRLESIAGARGRPPQDIDEDYSPMELEERFGEEDAQAHAQANAG